MLEWLHANHVWLGTLLFGFSLAWALLLGRIVGTWSRRIFWAKFGILAAVAGGSYGMQPTMFGTFHGMLLVIALGVVAMAPVGYIADRRNEQRA